MPPLIVRILVDDWHTFMPTPWVHVALIFVSVLCGGIMGGERERREKPAGLRTLMLVCLGSSLFTSTGYAFTTATGDSGRVAAQIVTGIGFLGAGVILHGRGSISGTTTAAAIWVTAAIGMLTATGYAGGALGASIVVRGMLLGVRVFSVRHYGARKGIVYEVDFEPDGGKTRIRIERVLGGFEVSGITADWAPTSAECGRLILHLRLPQHHRCELLGELADISEVSRIEATQGGAAKA